MPLSQPYVHDVGMAVTFIENCVDSSSCLMAHSLFMSSGSLEKSEYCTPS